jgi:DNA polymerase III subunit epsilon
MRWLRGPDLVPAARAYREATSPRVRDRMPFDELMFLVVDTETTGFKAGHDRILSLAAVEVRRGQIAARRTAEWLIFQPGVRVTDAVAVHGILPAETAAGEPEAAVLGELLALLPGAVLVGHHVHFDATMLDEALRRCFRTGLRNPLLDTGTLAMQVLEAFARTGYPGQRAPTLDEVCAHLGISMMDRHTAGGDAFTTAELFLILCARLRRQLGRPIRAGDLPLRRL